MHACVFVGQASWDGFEEDWRRSRHASSVVGGLTARVPIVYGVSLVACLGVLVNHSSGPGPSFVTICQGHGGTQALTPRLIGNYRRDQEWSMDGYTDDSFFYQV